MHFKPIFDPPLKKAVRGAPALDGECARRLGHSLAHVKIVPSKILDWHYKIVPSTDHHAKFHAGQTTHLGDLAREKKNKTSALKHKSFRKLSFSGGLKRIEHKK